MFNKKLAELMEEKGIIKIRLAEMTGITKQTVGDYLNGYYVPSQDRLKRIADALNVSVEYFGIPKKVKPEPAKVRNISVTKAAQLLGVSRVLVEDGLKQGTAKFGFAAIVGKNEDGTDKWRYHISPRRFCEYQGIDL